MQRLEVRGAVRPIYRSLGVKGLIGNDLKKKKSSSFDCVALLFKNWLPFDRALHSTGLESSALQ